MISSAELTRLWREHAAALLLLARSRCGVAIAQAEDCVQEAFIRLAAQAIVPQDCVAWLARVVRNAAIDAARSQRRRMRHEMTSRESRTELFEVADIAADRAQSEQVQLVLETLDEETRDVVIAHLWNNMTFRQIAEAFGLSTATAHRKYESGINSLRTSLRQSSVTLAEKDST